MYERVSLNGTWELRDEILSCDLSEAARLSELTGGWMPTPVPGDIHQGLIASGRIEEPLLGLNSYDCRWTEDRSWWFRKEFLVNPEWLEADAVELELDGLDSSAQVFLNGRHIGSHRNAFRPFVADIRPRLRVGRNVVLVRLTAGVETVSDADLDAPDGVRASTEAVNGRPERGDPRRTHVRKPQYSFGWDWSPRLATTAIAGNAEIRVLRDACIRHVALRPVRHRRQALVMATVTLDRLHYYKTAEGRVSLTLTDETGQRFSSECSALLRSGYTYAELTIPIPEPRLWWPNGMGDQHLYRVEAELMVGDARMSYPAFDYGLRFVELDTEGTFALLINGKKVFCKGANWIPSDALYARSSDERYDTLIREARDAHFNMLRIWGGGWYERDAFYAACDRNGIMIWHDFMFACAPYPDHLDWFRAEVEQEAEHQVRRLAHHACVVLWCGSNENNWGFRDWWHEQTKGGAWTYNYLLPHVVQRNCPQIPYWNGSPYGGEAPNSSEVGDRHHWHDCMMNPDMEVRITPEEYDKCTSLFVSEFGYVGACAKETVLTYVDGAPLDRRGPVWQHHNNTFEKDTVEAGIRKHYADPEGLTLDEYLLYSGLCQGLMLSYALESMRYRSACHGGLFWMYNDCWGEVGWTVIDYYLRRKPSWYAVRRAFAPLRLIARAEGEKVRVVLANDTQESLDLELEYGYVSLDGGFSDLGRCRCQALAVDRTELCAFPRGTHDPTQGLWIARIPQRPDIAPAILRSVDYRQLATLDPGLTHSVSVLGEGRCAVRVSSQKYAHAVRLLLPSGAVPSDNYFDLLPGETREVTIRSSEPLDPTGVEVTCVNAGRG
ncbi:MAG: beta-mannosidase [Anaerolineae bacterium]|nr:beta-mannosidase [Anaerolineae bacterium]